MKLKWEHRIGVKAPAEVVWQILSDLPGWAAWNPLYLEARGVVGFGELLVLTEAMPDRPRRVIRPRIMDWAPNEAIHWKQSEVFGLVDITRYLEIEKMHEAGCIFSNGQLYEGVLGRAYGQRIKWTARAGFTALGEALRDRAEARWREAGGDPT